MMNRSGYSAAVRRPMSERPRSVRLPSLYRTPTSSVESESRDPFGRDELLAKVEAVMMFVNEPVTLKTLSEVLGFADGSSAKLQIERLRTHLDAEESPFTVVEVAGGFRLLTRPIYHSWLLRLHRAGHELRLSPAAWETLTVIAYKQPVMKAEVEGIRGVACGDLIHLLMEKGLVRMAGRHDSLGRPQLFGTTKQFLITFGLNSLDELPMVPLLARTGKAKSST